MTRETDERQISIAEYAEANGCPAAAEHFGMPVGKVRYLVRKICDRNKRKAASEGHFVKVSIPDMVSFRIGGTLIEMDISDFRRVFGL